MAEAVRVPEVDLTRRFFRRFATGFARSVVTGSFRLPYSSHFITPRYLAEARRNGSN